MSALYSAAVIGVGRAIQSGKKGGGHQIGYTHARMLKRHPKIDLAACADINQENLRAFQEIFMVKSGFDSYRKMLEEVKPEIVTIGTYVGLHGQMIVDSALSGVKGIVCEKPFLASPADIEKAREVVKETGVKIVVAHVRRYLPVFQRAKQLYNDGTVGEPIMCFAGIEGWDLSEWGAHWLDMFRFFHNDLPVKWVMGQTKTRNFRGYGHAMEEHGIAYFEFENGGKGFLDGGCRMNGPFTMILNGTEGAIRIIGENKIIVESASGQQSEDFTDQMPSDWKKLGYQYDKARPWPATWDMMLDDLVKWIEGGNTPIVGIPSMFETAELNLAAYLSSVNGDRIELPLSDYSVNEWPVEILARRHI